MNAGTLTSENAGQLIDIGSNTRLTLVDGTINGNLNIADGGILSGSGDIFGDLTLATDGSLQFSLGGTNDLLGEYDQLNVFNGAVNGNPTGNVWLGGMLDVLFLNAFSPSAGDTFDLITADSIFDNGFMFDFENPALMSGLGYAGNIVSDGSRNVLQLSFYAENSNVPEPGSIWLLLIGLVCLSTIRYRARYYSS